MRKNIFVFSLILCCFVHIGNSLACTSVIISGKVTPDGRPLMWKHRDTEVKANHIAYYKNGGYAYLALVNSGKEMTDDVWAGTNDKGFSIMNTASFNLNNKESDIKDREGRVMKLALEKCATLADFEKLLDTLPRPLGVEANFGVIDAFGGAAYYETSNERYIKKDVNDEKLAPDGYLIYTNFSFEGRKDEGLGYVRYESAKKIFEEMSKEGFTVQNIMRDASRSFYNSLLGIDLKKNSTPTGWFFEQDMIPRRESTAAVIFQGVKLGMNPELTVMWSALGYPPTAVTIPLWVKMGQQQPESLLCDNQLGTAPFYKYATELRDKVYSIPAKKGGSRYLNWTTLWNNEKSGYIQQLDRIEDEIFSVFTENNKKWERKDSLDIEKVEQMYKDLNLSDIYMNMK